MYVGMFKGTWGPLHRTWGPPAYMLLWEYAWERLGYFGINTYRSFEALSLGMRVSGSLGRFVNNVLVSA